MKANVHTALWVAALALLSPAFAAACPVCTSAQTDEVQRAFIVASVFLSLTPLSLIGGAILYLRRRARQLAAEEAASMTPLPRSA